MIRTSTFAPWALALGLVVAGAAPAEAQTRRRTPRPDAPRADGDERKRDDLVEDLLRKALERARENGRDELADRLEEQLDRLVEGRDELRRRVLPRRRDPNTPSPEARERAPRRERPRVERRENEAGETEIYVGMQGESGDYELGYAPASRTVRVTMVTERGNRRELTYELGKGLSGLKDLWDDVQRFRDEPKEEEPAPAPRRRNRRGTQSTSPF